MFFTSSFLFFFLFFFFFASASFLSSSRVFSDDVSTTITFGPLSPAGSPDIAEYPRAELAWSGWGKFWACGLFSVPGRFNTHWSVSDLAGKYFLSGGAPWILVIEIPADTKIEIFGQVKHRRRKGKASLPACQLTSCSQCYETFTELQVCKYKTIFQLSWLSGEKTFIEREIGMTDIEIRPHQTWPWDLAELLVYEGLCQAPKQEQLYNVGLKDCSTSNELDQLLRHQLAMRSQAFSPSTVFV